MNINDLLESEILNVMRLLVYHHNDYSLWFTFPDPTIKNNFPISYTVYSLLDGKRILTKDFC